MEDNRSLTSIHSVAPTPDTLAKLIKRLRVLTVSLLPLEVDPKSINDPTSRIITPKVISAYIAAGGDLVEALPYCLLRARRDFMIEANRDAADYGENRGRAIACEVLARRIVHKSPADRVPAIMSSRYKHRQADGDIEVSSAIELAIDSHCTIFLSSSEAQDVINSLWRGDLVQRDNEDLDVDCSRCPLRPHGESIILGHFDTSRIAVPSYHNFLRIVVWLFFLVVYSQAVREPIERLGPLHHHFEIWEPFFWKLPDLSNIFKTLRLATWRAFGISGLASHEEKREQFRLHSFQVLSCVAPLICRCCTELLTVFDGFKYIGTMQICVARMLRESGIFFALLSILAIGFLQGLYALDAADGQVENSSVIVHVMVQSLLQSPNYDKFAGTTAGQTLYYFWNVATTIVLLNVLISLFASAYSDVIDDAEAEYLSFFAGKAVAMVRAPDTYVYPAPFNLVETFLVAPLESLNRFVMSVLFFIPMTIIALYESFSPKKRWLDVFINGAPLEDEDSPLARDPDVGGEDAASGLVISRVPFSELVKEFPNIHESSEVCILKEIDQVKAQLDALTKRLDGKIL
ncbi:calcium activated cation channel [Lactarius quietus]|nr:calcium activated cation channel [Lactarius quietus]